MEFNAKHLNNKQMIKCDSIYKLSLIDKSHNLDIDINKNIKIEDKKFLYELLLCELPSTIIDIVIIYVSEICDYYKCGNLYLLKGIICDKCGSQYCSNQCYNCKKCNNCKSITCELCFMECSKCDSYCCLNCMFKESDFYQIYYYCNFCYYEKNDLLLNWENRHYNNWSSSD